MSGAAIDRRPPIATSACARKALAAADADSGGRSDRRIMRPLKIHFLCVQQRKEALAVG